LVVAALLLGGGLAWLATASQSATTASDSGTGTGTGDSAGGQRDSVGSGACAGMLGDQPVSGDYVILWETADVLFQDSYTLEQACQIARDRFGSGVRVLDSSDYWDLNVDLNRYGIWTVFSGPYSKSQAGSICSAKGSCNVRLIQPCSRSDGQACGG
jgi:hypothetical protein